jgi:hypothetical protein
MSIKLNCIKAAFFDSMSMHKNFPSEFLINHVAKCSKKFFILLNNFQGKNANEMKMYLGNGMCVVLHQIFFLCDVWLGMERNFKVNFLPSKFNIRFWVFSMEKLTLEKFRKLSEKSSIQNLVKKAPKSLKKLLPKPN